MENIKYRFRVRRKGNGVETIDFFYFTMGMLLDNFLLPFKKYEEYEILSVDRFTGLYDLLKTEIYENDIFSHDKSRMFINQIIFRHGCFGYASDYNFIPLGRNHHYFQLTKDSHQSHEIKVIGNIHENPELIEK
ncbi:hypothetical protein KAU43_01425 [candidate division WOR-3 bacterium]|nr:hypothetical protein [candidate division WOR-3 bacterium]